MTTIGQAWQELLRSLNEQNQEYQYQGTESEYRASMQAEFPLCQDVDFEYVFFGETGWPLGLRNSNPSKFNRRAYAGGLSAFLIAHDTHPQIS
jgi:hypothetical protein